MPQKQGQNHRWPACVREHHRRKFLQRVELVAEPSAQSADRRAWGDNRKVSPDMRRGVYAPNMAKLTRATATATAASASTGSRIESKCRITGVGNPARLAGSHCKPRRDATNEERFGGKNGLLLTRSIDHLINQGVVGFEDDGALIIATVAHR